MTKAQRESVVEALRCAADCGSLSRAEHWLGIGPMSVSWKVKRDVQKDPYFQRMLVQFPLTDEQYRELLLEAAARVEEGQWP